MEKMSEKYLIRVILPKDMIDGLETESRKKGYQSSSHLMFTLLEKYIEDTSKIKEYEGKNNMKKITLINEDTKVVKSPCGHNIWNITKQNDGSLIFSGKRSSSGSYFWPWLNQYIPHGMVVTEVIHIDHKTEVWRTVPRDSIQQTLSFDVTNNTDGTFKTTALIINLDKQYFYKRNDGLGLQVINDLSLAKEIYQNAAEKYREFDGSKLKS